MYIPLHNEAKKHFYFRLRLSKLCFFTVSLPFCAFIGCVLLTMYKDFESANNTHCKVPNFLPSISASIGNYEPQRTIWQTAIYVHAIPRLLIISLRWKSYLSAVLEDYSGVVNFTILLNVIENLSLLGLTFWTSAKYYPYHEVCFKTFIGASIFYMLFVCILLSKFRRRKIVTNNEKKSLKYKWRLLLTNIISFACAAYFFLRHNKFCEPYVYSMFGFSEYIVVTTNIAFHLSNIYDIPQQYVILNRFGLSVE